MWKRIREHPLIPTFGGIVLFFAALWPLLSEDTVPAFLTKKGWLLAMPSWYSLLVIAIGCAVLLLQITLIRRTRESKELVNLHRELDTAHQTIAELQAKLVTIED